MECDQCGEVDPARHVAIDRARLIARREGWLLKQPYGHLCPECAKPVKVEIAQKEAHKKALKAAAIADRQHVITARLAKFEAALKMRAEGKTFKEIGEAFGVSASRGQQILRQAERHDAKTNRAS